MDKANKWITITVYSRPVYRTPWHCCSTCIQLDSPQSVIVQGFNTSIPLSICTKQAKVQQNKFHWTHVTDRALIFDKVWMRMVATSGIQEQTKLFPFYKAKTKKCTSLLICTGTLEKEMARKQHRKNLILRNQQNKLLMFGWNATIPMFVG